MSLLRFAVPALTPEDCKAVQMGDGCELEVQSAAAFAQCDEELSYWQLQVPSALLHPEIAVLHVASITIMGMMPLCYLRGE